MSRSSESRTVCPVEEKRRDHDADATVAGEAPPASDAVARGLGIAGLVVGAVGVVVALVSRRRSAA